MAVKKKKRASPKRKRTARPRRPLKTSAKIESIVITWCSHKDNKRRRMEVDLRAAGGLMWRHDPRRPVKPIGLRPGLEAVPHKSIQLLGECPDNKPHLDPPPDPCCWWDQDRAQWVCPDDPFAPGP